MNTPDQRVVGHRVIRKDSAIKVTGEAIYAGDIKMPGMLYGKALRSQYPHAKILSIDTSAAEAIEGVHCVMTARDLPGINRKNVRISLKMIILPSASIMPTSSRRQLLPIWISTVS